MAKQLPPRPNLDFLRKQAKELLVSLAEGEKESIATFREHLPAAQGLSDAQIKKAKYRLADAQSAIARKTGFASWPALSRHVEQLRALEGTWEFISLEVDGRAMPPAMSATSKILIDGDRFRSETPGAIYEGVFNIDVEKQPHGIDIEFVEGPEAGNTNYGIFALSDEDELTICLDMTGNGRPGKFKTSSGSGHALERLRRASKSRPTDVKGGTGKNKSKERTKCGSAADFSYRPDETLTKLQGTWVAVGLTQDGQAMPSFIAATGKRVAEKNELKVWFGGQLVIHALVKIDEQSSPTNVDYLHKMGAGEGMLQHGIMKWEGEEACFCMAPPGSARPSDFSCPKGSGQMYTRWRKTK